MIIECYSARELDAPWHRMGRFEMPGKRLWSRAVFSCDSMPRSDTDFLLDLGIVITSVEN